MPQSCPTTGPVRFLAPYDFLPVRPSEAHRNFTLVLFLWSHQATAPIRLDTALHLWFDQIIHRTPHGPHAMPTRASYGSHMGICNVFHILRAPRGTCKGDVQHPYGHLRELTQPEFAYPRASYVAVRGPYGPLTTSTQAVHALFKTSKPVWGL